MKEWQEPLGIRASLKHSGRRYGGLKILTPNSRFTVTARCQEPFVARRLMISQQIAGLFVIENIRVGAASQLMGSLPAFAFDGHDFTMDVVGLGVDLTLDVLFIGSEPTVFRAVMLGRTNRSNNSALSLSSDFAIPPGFGHWISHESTYQHLAIASGTQSISP